MPRKAGADIDSTFKPLVTHNSTVFAMIRVSGFVNLNHLTLSMAGVIAGVKRPFFDEIGEVKHNDI
jgi:hypothetical protein